MKNHGKPCCVCGAKISVYRPANARTCDKICQKAVEFRRSRFEQIEAELGPDEAEIFQDDFGKTRLFVERMAREEENYNRPYLATI